MSPMLRKSLMIIPLALLGSLAAMAQTASFEGTVKGDDGKPLQGAQVKIERKDVKGNYNVKTDKKGHYFYGGLQLGTYDITVAINGQDKDKQTGIRASLGDAKDVSFDLSKVAAAAPGGPVVDPDANRGLSAAEKADIDK